MQEKKEQTHRIFTLYLKLSAAENAEARPCIRQRKTAGPTPRPHFAFYNQGKIRAGLSSGDTSTAGTQAG